MSESGIDAQKDVQPKEQLTLVTKDELPDHRGYRLTYVPVGEGMLRPKGYGIEKGFIPYPEWADRYHRGLGTAHAETPIPLVYTSDEGLSLFHDLDGEWLREHIFDPASWNGIKIGEGSE